MRKLLICIAILLVPTFAWSGNAPYVVTHSARQWQDPGNPEVRRVTFQITNPTSCTFVEGCYEIHLADREGQEIYSRYTPGVPWRECIEINIPPGTSASVRTELAAGYSTSPYSIEVEMVTGFGQCRGVLVYYN